VTQTALTDFVGKILQKSTIVLKLCGEVTPDVNECPPYIKTENVVGIVKNESQKL
jgi:hypothetical protein